MHELSIAQNIVDIVQQYVPDTDSGNVRTVRMKVGELSGVVSESLEFCFGAIIMGTPLEGAHLAIEQIPLQTECRKCGNVFRVEEYNFRCPACASDDISIVSGRELQVTEIELNDGGKS
jgi:hydrogenase nickel incorporation protein HypA/HybF